ncbi:MAG TPA: amidohydrolase family protein [Patescibacteria group bacterium]|nr:amidohydrolase family protein [Patescibacteria group bacterium]
MRNIPVSLRRSALLSLFISVTWLTPRFGSLAAELLPPGFHPLPPGVHALVGGRIVVRPGEVVEGGTVVIRDGLISAVGKEATVPADARVWDLKGMTVYAGFIDSYLMLEATNAPVSTTEVETDSGLRARGVRFFGTAGEKSGGPGYEIAKITPQYRAVRDYAPKPKKLEPLRELGFTAGLIAPSRGIIRGTSALVALSDDDPNQSIIRPDVFQHVAFDTQRGEDRAYPGSLMGIIATLRQSFFDAQYYARDYTDFEKHPGERKRPEFDPALEALGPVLAKKMFVMLEPGSALMADRAAQVAKELGFQLHMVASGQEWRRPDLVKATGASFVVPLNFPAVPKLPSTDDWDQVTLDELRAWDWAPENPALLRQQGLEIALTTYGLSDVKRFRDNLRLSLDRGLSENDALAALTTVPARLCGVEKMLGTIEPGKLADLTVVKGDNYFNPDSKVSAVWIDGRVYQVPGEEPGGGEAEAKQSKAASKEESRPTPAKEEPEKKPKPPEIAAPEKKPVETASTTNTTSASQGAKEEKKKERVREAQKKRVARSPMENRGPLVTPKAILIRGATVWTCGPDGRLENADVLVIEGKIKAIGINLSADTGPAGPPLLIDGHGLHVSPGLIDCHSHTAILGAVNESTLPSTAMVRIHDVVNSETDNLYEQLAGGVTTANLLHGSANPIGGQNCVIKLRDGASPEELVFAEAPPGIKFALGENVKQSNWGERFAARFPQTRMGVQTLIANRFTAAREYLDAIAASRKSGAQSKLEPRRNLELEAIGEILEGKRWIHCHAYRQDEMLMLMRLMESFGVKIATFQHVLEGYKIADEIAKHGAGGSTFSDWWAYKFEVYDAIPYNGSLMRDRGVVVSFNSDSSELARRLYLEAAKSVKYGGTPELDALKFVTLNPAKQLRIDQHIGSLEPGKDGDFAVWSKSPLDFRTVCLQTWIDGKKYFDRSVNEKRVQQRVQEREDLIAKAKQIAKLSSGGGDSGSKDGDGFFRVSLEHEYDGVDRGCMEEGR